MNELSYQPVKPVLSIGMIFKNDIHCIERCLKSLEPLYRAIPCELIMADTGSTDGSREIADQYADLVFDFQGMADLTTARNAVLDRCSGIWYLSIDCDEWLGDDLSHLLRFLYSNNKRYLSASMTFRNYTACAPSQNYEDFITCRIIRRSSNQRYGGKIHKHFDVDLYADNFFLQNTILHHDGYVNPSSEETGHTVPLPLEGICKLGQTAEILATDNKEILEEKLKDKTLFDSLHPYAVVHALQCGIRFPLPDQLWYLEDMDRLAARLTTFGKDFQEIVERYTSDFDDNDLHQLGWAHSLILAAVNSNDWENVNDQESIEYNMQLAHRFTDLEQQFISRCYASELLTEDNLYFLPPVHRFGWYCWWAFHELERDKKVEYVRLLRQGLDANKNMKPMVEFLIHHSKELYPIMEVSPELEMLANQVRTILAQYSPDDPAVISIKQSEAYRKVAVLLESNSTPVWGGQLQ